METIETVVPGTQSEFLEDGLNDIFFSLERSSLLRSGLVAMHILVKL
jgi:hypothetical protein